MKIPEGIAEFFGKNYTYRYILTLINYIYDIIQAEHFWFKEYINNITRNVVFKQCNNDHFILYGVNKFVLQLSLYTYMER